MKLYLSIIAHSLRYVIFLCLAAVLAWAITGAATAVFYEESVAEYIMLRLGLSLLWLPVVAMYTLVALNLYVVWLKRRRGVECIQAPIRFDTYGVLWILVGM